MLAAWNGCPRIAFQCRAPCNLCPGLRWNKDSEACLIDEIPHKRLTRPRKVFEYFFEGEKRGRGRENIIKLEVVETGVLNAIVFWFDLHLDSEETITTGTRGRLAWLAAGVEGLGQDSYIFSCSHAMFFIVASNLVLFGIQNRTFGPC
jgi:hypothetical protein